MILKLKLPQRLMFYDDFDFQESISTPTPDFFSFPNAYLLSKYWSLWKNTGWITSIYIWLSFLSYSFIVSEFINQLGSQSLETTLNILIINLWLFLFDKEYSCSFLFDFTNIIFYCFHNYLWVIPLLLFLIYEI